MWNNVYKEERCQLGQLKLAVEESFSMCEPRRMSSTSTGKGVISHCWESKAGLRNWEHKPSMTSKSCLRCRRAWSFCCPWTARPGGGRKGTEWEEKEWGNKGKKVRKLLLLNKAMQPQWWRWNLPKAEQRLLSRTNAQSGFIILALLSSPSQGQSCPNHRKSEVFFPICHYSLVDKKHKSTIASILLPTHPAQNKE